jgi:hypothetical protein
METKNGKVISIELFFWQNKQTLAMKKRVDKKGIAVTTGLNVGGCYMAPL